MDIFGLRIQVKDGSLSVKRKSKMAKTLPISPPVQLINLKDRIPEIKAIIPGTQKSAVIPPVRSPVLGYNSDRYTGRGSFIEAEYDLGEVGRVEDTEAYVRQAFDKKVALMFKEGWDVIGSNPKTVKYIRTRFSQMSRASGTPVHKLFRSVGSSLIRKSNSPRQTGAGRIRT